jgi:hypothetical protein
MPFGFADAWFFVSLALATLFRLAANSGEASAPDKEVSLAGLRLTGWMRDYWPVLLMSQKSE